MAAFNAIGIEPLMLSMQEISEIPEDVKTKMVSAAADIAVKAFKAAVPVDTGQLRDSIKKKVVSGKEPYALVYPMGKREDGVRNAEVGFILEYGAPKKKLPARQWMSKANDDNMDAYEKAEFDVYAAWIDSKGI